MAITQFLKYSVTLISNQMHVPSEGGGDCVVFSSPSSYVGL